MKRLSDAFDNREKPDSRRKPMILTQPYCHLLMSDRIAVVTGASSGIGRACSIALNAAGWIVILTARREAELEETVKLMGDAKHPRTRYIPGDLTRIEDVKKLFDIVRNDYGKSTLYLADQQAALTFCSTYVPFTALLM